MSEEHEQRIYDRCVVRVGQLEADNERLRELCADLCNKNAKLHELVRAAWRCIHTGVSCSDCRLIAGGCTLRTAMRDLGIEVDG